LGYGTAVSVEWLARRMIILAERGAHNMNIVTGTQYAPQIVKAVKLARQKGFGIPVVWNTSGFEKPETIEMLAGTVDIYLTDIKYADDSTALEYSNAPRYFEISTQAAKCMLDQVGPLKVDDSGIGTRGVIIRHLVLPGGLAGTEKVARFIVDELGLEVPISVLGQFFPAFRAKETKAVGRRLTTEEYELAKRQVLQSGIEIGWFQEL
jgi:putative pyruvate formate lyase activating enzyme